jgi:hypothetical protein
MAFEPHLIDVLNPDWKDGIHNQMSHHAGGHGLCADLLASSFPQFHCQMRLVVAASIGP